MTGPGRGPGLPPAGPARRGLVALVAVQLKAAGVTLLALALLFGIVPFAQHDARAAAPRVVIVVGPVGDLTDHYRADGAAAATVARRFTDDVVTVFSPNATWPVVRKALAGASLVVYLGHGNGWPSRYSAALNPRSQDGLGLNPVAGADDEAHQYFGERYLATRVRLAPGALVVLSYLCYASGNSEPGLPEGTLDVARQRVDNFAAGWLAAGAGAVIADAYLPPARYVRAALAGEATYEEIWRGASSFNDHVLAFPSDRTPGAVAMLDPEHRTGGYSRSLVVADGAATIPGAVGLPSGPGGASGGWELVAPPDPAARPDAFALGARPGEPALAGPLAAGAPVQLGLPVEVPADVRFDASYRLGVRWIPLDAPSTWAGDGPSGSGLVAPEASAALVEVVAATSGPGGLSAPARLPPVAGRYRLEVTLHDADGVALPYAVQASIPPVIVHVGGAGSAWLDAPASLSVTAGTAASVRLVVVNGEADAWGPCPTPAKRMGLDEDRSCPVVRVVGRWVAIADAGETPPAMATVVTAAAGTAAPAWLAGRVPPTPGVYLLVATVERAAGAGAPVEVLGRPSTTVVEVLGAPLLPPGS